MMDIQPPTLLGFSFDTWLGILTAALAAYAVIVLARRKRRSFSALGDEPHEETESAADGVEPGRPGDSTSNRP